MFQKIKTYLPTVAAVSTLLAAASARAEGMTSLIDFSTLATNVQPLITTAVTAAAGLGAAILAARLCWGFFKKFARG